MAADQPVTTPEREALDERGLDPELVSLRKTRGPVGPILAAAIVLCCGYFMIKLVPDLRFSRQGDSPREVSDVSKVALREGYGPEEFVVMRAHPDRSFAVRVAPSGSTEGSRVAPVLGTDGKLWVMVGGEPWAEKASYDDVFRGRLRELDDLPYAESLRGYAAKAGPTPQSISADSLRTGLEGKATSLRRPGGDTIGVTESTPVTVAETVADRAVVEAYIRPERLPDHAAWTAALADAGIVTGSPVISDEDHLVYHVDGDVESVKARIASRQLYAARARPLVVERASTWGELHASSGGLRVGGAEVPWSSVSAVMVEAPRAVPSDAMVLVTDEAPGAYWYMLPLYAILGLFAVLFGWALVRGVLPEKAPEGAGKRAETAA